MAKLLFGTSLWRYSRLSYAMRSNPLIPPEAIDLIPVRYRRLFRRRLQQTVVSSHPVSYYLFCIVFQVQPLSALKRLWVPSANLGHIYEWSFSLWTYWKPAPLNRLQQHSTIRASVKKLLCRRLSWWVYTVHAMSKFFNVTLYYRQNLFNLNLVGFIYTDFDTKFESQVIEKGLTSLLLFILSARLKIPDVRELVLRDLSSH